MKKSTEIRSGRHCVFILHAHLIFVTKYRKNIFKPEYIVFLKNVFIKVCKEFNCELKEINGEQDHIHLLVNYPPKVSVSKLVNSLKGVSSRRLKQTYPELKQYYWKDSLWSPSYFAGSCGGAPLEILKQYIEEQKSTSISPT